MHDEIEEGERRHLTVMFCDLVGSTQLSERADPEVVRSVLRAYRAVLDEAVTRVEGTIALWIGDGALVYFGHPVPHEDDAWRAVHAGLALLDGLHPVAADARERHGIDLAVRVAVHTGLVIRAEMGTPNAPDRHAIVGSTPNMAARLQDKARPGSMIISGATYALVPQRFEVVPVGPFELKGIDGPVGAFEVVRELPTPEAVVALAEGSTFVGRADELAGLLERWDEVRRGGTASVALRGDPGIGKTRLSAELRQRVVAGGHRTLVSACSVFHRSTPLHPVRRVVEVAAEVDAGTPPAEVVERLRQSLEPVGLVDALPVIAALLDAHEAGGLEPLDLEPQQLREVTLGAIVSWLAGEAAVSPLLLVVDDLQWADPTTADLVGRVVSRRIPGLMLLLTARTGHPLPWGPATVPVVELTPLAEHDVRALVAELSGDLADGLVETVLGRADGVPLFVEELVNGALAPEASRRHVDLPASLRDPLLTRLAAAGDDLGLAQLVATIGDDVSVGLLASVTGRDGAELGPELKSLIALGLLEPGLDGSTVRFHHHLMAELAYETQLHSTRRARHGAVADAILRGAAPEAEPSLPRHLEHAGRFGEAIVAHVEAARAAGQRGSDREATQLLDHAATLLEPIPAGIDRDGLEVLILENRAYTTASQLGYAAPGAVEDYDRCRALLQGMPEGRSNTLVALYSFYAMRGQLDITEELNLDYRRRLRDAHGQEFSADAGSAMISFFRGDYAAAARYADVFLSSPEGQIDTPLIREVALPNDIVTTILGLQATTLVITGDLAGARRCEAAVGQRVEQLPFPWAPYSLAFAKSLLACGQFSAGLHDEVRATFAEIRGVASRYGTTSWTVLSNFQDAALAARYGPGATTDHATVMLEVWRATGAVVFIPCFSTVLVEGRRREGDLPAAVAVATAHLDAAEAAQLPYWSSPLLRLRGTCRLESGDDDGRDDLWSATDLARSQGAWLFGLQAACELARLAPTDEHLEVLAGWTAEAPAGAAGLPDVATAHQLLDAAR